MAPMRRKSKSVQPTAAAAAPEAAATAAPRTPPTCGLVVGRFYPPHLGHHAFIDDAARRVDQLVVLVTSAHFDSIAPADRVAWLRTIHASTPGCQISVVSVPCDIPTDYADGPIWKAHAALVHSAFRMCTGAEAPDVVFGAAPPTAHQSPRGSFGDPSSELAARLGAKYVQIKPKPGPSGMPITSAAVRADMATHWDSLHPVVRAGLATRVIIVGAESTGTTTLARDVSAHFRQRGGAWGNTTWVKEWGRDYTYAKLEAVSAEATAAGRPQPTMADLVWTARDFADIATEQTRIENLAASACGPLLICDTDALATSVWEYRYLGADSHGADRAATIDLPPRALYLLTDHRGVSFEQDEIRDGQHIRENMTDWFRDRLTREGHSWCMLTGTRTQRTALAVRVVDGLLSQRLKLREPLR